MRIVGLVISEADDFDIKEHSSLSDLGKSFLDSYGNPLGLVSEDSSANLSEENNSCTWVFLVFDSMEDSRPESGFIARFQDELGEATPVVNVSTVMAVNFSCSASRAKDLGARKFGVFNSLFTPVLGCDLDVSVNSNPQFVFDLFKVHAREFGSKFGKLSV